ncbi:MAG: 2-phospho-L-lactate transferase [Spongiibacteraceae bacterium]
MSHKQILALSGGVGGAKLALGLARVLPAEQLTVVCNTGDDFEHLGLKICPDLDTVMYTLAGRSHPEQGWGLANESWQVMDTLRELQGETWFNLGDRDLATHLLRSQLLRQGLSLSAVTQHLCHALGIAQKILPMSDDTVSTSVLTENGVLAFQHYFVRERCAPAVRGFVFRGIEHARPHPEMLRLLGSDELMAVVICPSNPFLSIDPILALPGLREALRASPAPVIAVSPIVAGNAIKGPTAKILRELNLPCSPMTIAEHYRDIVDGVVLDQLDETHAPAIFDLGIAATVTNTVMRSLDDREQLAHSVLSLASTLAGKK